MPARDIAIYSPYIGQLLERDTEVSGGAELQAMMLAESSVTAGLTCGLMTIPVETPRTDLPRGLEMVPRKSFADVKGKLDEVRSLWDMLDRADARIYVIRGGWPALGVAAMFCRRKRRRLVFAATSDRNFVSLASGLKRIDEGIYRFGARRSDAIVAQTAVQLRMARESFGRAGQIVEIPSFAEEAPASAAEPEAFLWAGRLIDYKNPSAYLRLARSVPEARFWMIPKFADEDAAAGKEALAAERELPNLELVVSRPRGEMMELVDRAVAIVNTSPKEGMPNMFLEGWARGIPALTYEFDPDGRIAAQGLGEAADGDDERFAAAARRLWAGRGGRAELRERVRRYLHDTHGRDAVGRRWLELFERLS
jgi:glycosyltransferase involved in cell wall biosynthesis